MAEAVFYQELTEEKRILKPKKIFTPAMSARLDTIMRIPEENFRPYEGEPIDLQLFEAYGRVYKRKDQCEQAEPKTRTTET